MSGLFAGGTLSEQDKDAVMKALQDIYWESKARNVEKYTPKKIQEDRYGRRGITVCVSVFLRIYFDCFQHERGEGPVIIRSEEIYKKGEQHCQKLWNKRYLEDCP